MASAKKTKPTDRQRKRDRIAKAFRAYHATHPEVYRFFCKAADKRRKSGHTRWSADCIFHHLRFEEELNARSEGGFKVNNDFAALYARLWLKDHPTAKDFFETRRRKTG